LALPISKFEAAADLPVEASIANENGFAPLHALQTTMRFWWFIFLLMLAGGGIAWLIHRIQPSQFEAVARFSANIDYVSTGPLSQYEEDTALNGIGDLIYSNAVIQKVVDRAAAEGIRTSLVELKRAAVLERRFDIWELRVRNADPNLAERLANLWVEQGQAALIEGYQHALQADHINRYLLSLENCLAETAASEPSSAQCSRARFAQIQEDIRQAGKVLSQERLASRGLFSGVMIGPVDQASLPEKPVIYQRNQVILAGCLIGFLLGAGFVQLGIPARWLAGGLAK
jgi:uncharacterized protein involved in exopolysaccharide biosynthesis